MCMHARARRKGKHYCCGCSMRHDRRGDNSSRAASAVLLQQGGGWRPRTGVLPLAGNGMDTLKAIMVVSSQRGSLLWHSLAALTPSQVSYRSLASCFFEF